MASGPVRTLHIGERGETILPLTHAQAVELQALNFCSVLPTGTAGEWRVRDVTKVGVVALDGLRIMVRPKTPLRSILFMASYSGEQVAPAEATFDYNRDLSVPVALAQALVDTTRTALKRGLIKGYVPREKQGHVVRGRWDIARQLTVRPGIPIPLELTFDEFTEDVPENRILHTAIRRIAKFEALPGQVAQDLDRLLPLFADVAVLTPGAIVPATRRTRLNAHYSPALAIARLILEASSWAHAEGGTRGRSFLVDMPRVFERFVGIALTSRLASLGLTVELQDSDWRLDQDRRVILRPDIVISRNGEPVTVADTKYKVWGASAGSPSNDNVYQALAYAIALGVPDSHLIYVSGDIEPRSYPIPAAGKTVIAHAIGLGGSPEQVLRSVSDLGDVLVADRGSALVG